MKPKNKCGIIAAMSGSATIQNDIVREIKKQYPYLKSQFGVEKIGIFGSVAKDTATENSDLDLVVELNKPLGFKFVLLVEYLENVFARKVDVLTHAGIKNIRLKNVSAEIEQAIIYV